MASGSVTSTGVSETRTAVRAFPRAAQLAYRSVAFRASRRVADGARARLQAQTHGTGATAARIRVIEQEDRKQFIVVSDAPPGKPANLVLWIEMGTIRQQARPYMGPAALAESESYRRDMQQASEQVARETFMA